MDAAIRSEIEHHGDAASYVFAGSHVGMMRELFTSKRRAFYGQASPIDLGPLAHSLDVAEYLHARFAAGQRPLAPAALDLMLDVARGHPQRTMLLAHFLWETTPARHPADVRVRDRARPRARCRDPRRGTSDLGRPTRHAAPCVDSSRRQQLRALQLPNPGQGRRRTRRLPQAGGDRTRRRRRAAAQAPQPATSSADPLLGIWVAGRRGVGPPNVHPDHSGANRRPYPVQQDPLCHRTSAARRDGSAQGSACGSSPSRFPAALRCSQ